MTRGTHKGRIPRIASEIWDIWSCLAFIGKIIECYMVRFQESSMMCLVKQSIKYIVGMPIGDGSNPEWARTRYSIERISDPFKCG